MAASTTSARVPPTAAAPTLEGVGLVSRAPILVATPAHRKAAREATDAVVYTPGHDLAAWVRRRGTATPGRATLGREAHVIHSSHGLNVCIAAT